MIKSFSWLFAIYLVGSLCLPIASFERYRDLPDPSVPVLGNAIAFENPWNRGLLLGSMALCVLAVLATRHRSQFLSVLRTGWLDYLGILWITTPILVGVFNPSPFLNDVCQSAYLSVAWGGPYLAGRFLTKNRVELVHCLIFLMIAGVVSFVVALSEMMLGRWLYRLLYGYHPFQSIGESRWFGQRPLLCFEDPNQVAMWWMTIAIGAMILVPSWGIATKQTRWKWGAFSLPFLFQGVGAAVLTVAGALALCVRRIPHWKYVLAVVLAVGFLLFLARGPILTVARQVTQQTGMEDGLKRIFRKSEIGSFGWRMAREEEGSRLNQEHPIAGWGTVMYWRDFGKQERPWGLVSLMNGAYGIIGTTTLLLFLFAPLTSGLFKDRFGEPSKRTELVRFGIPVLIALHGVDALMNSAFLLPVLYLYGAWVSTEQTPC